MKYLVACLMAFGFYGLTFGQIDTTSRSADTTGMVEEPALTCYMVDESTFLCTTEEEIETEEDVLREDEILREEDVEEGTIEEEEIEIEGREEDVTGEPESHDEEIPAEPERESDEGILPDDESENLNNQESDEVKREEEMNTY